MPLTYYINLSSFLQSNTSGFSPLSTKGDRHLYVSLPTAQTIWPPDSETIALALREISNPDYLLHVYLKCLPCLEKALPAFYQYIHNKTNFIDVHFIN